MMLLVNKLFNIFNFKIENLKKNKINFKLIKALIYNSSLKFSK